jgi:hypothetical protein
MKRLVLFREGSKPFLGELDDYLHVSEIVKYNYVDMEPSAEWYHSFPDGVVHITDWDLVFKDDDKYDYWHLVSETSDESDVHHTRSIALLEPYRSEWCVLTAVIRDRDILVCIWRLDKAVSELIQSHIPYLLPTFKEDTYSYEILRRDLEQLVSTFQRKEIEEDVD